MADSFAAASTASFGSTTPEWWTALRTAPLDASRLFSKIAMDEAASVIRRYRTRPPTAETWRRIISEVEQAHASFEDRGWLSDPASYHLDPPPLRHVRLLRTRAGGIDFEHLQFRSRYEPRGGEPGRDRWLNYAPCRTSHAWVVRHRGRPRPWLVCVPGYGMGMPLVDLIGFQVTWLSQRLGLNVAIPVLPFHGPRRIARISGDGFFSGDCLDTLHAETQAVWDIRRLISWVRSRTDQAVGVYGISLGGYTAALLSAFERNLACVIAAVPCSEFITLGLHHTPRAVVEEAENLGMDWKMAERVFRVVSPLAMPSQVPSDRLCLLGGRVDRIVPASQVEKLWHHWNQPQIIWYQGSHLSFAFETEVRACLRNTLRARLCEGGEPPEQMRAA